MPFTISHPAAILPLKHIWPRWFSLTGLMAGAMSPDLLYFLILNTTERGYSHSWTGLFIFCFPIGVAFAFAFHKLFKYHLIFNLPRPFDRIFSGLAVSEFKVRDVHSWLVLVFSILVGALSHFGWDSFTHAGGEIAQMVPFLMQKSTILGMLVPNHIIAQHLSTLFGAIFLPLYIIKFKLVPEPVILKSVNSPHRKFVFWATGFSIAIIFAFAMAFLFNLHLDWRVNHIYNLRYAYKTFGLAGWAGFFYWACFYSKLKKRKLET